MYFLLDLFYHLAQWLNNELEEFYQKLLHFVLFHSEIMFESFNIPGLYIAVQVSKRKSMFCNKPLPLPLSVKLHKSISMMLWNAC